MDERGRCRNRWVLCLVFTGTDFLDGYIFLFADSDTFWSMFFTHHRGAPKLRVRCWDFAKTFYVKSIFVDYIKMYHNNIEALEQRLFGAGNKTLVLGYELTFVSVANVGQKNTTWKLDRSTYIILWAIVVMKKIISLHQKWTSNIKVLSISCY